MSLIITSFRFVYKKFLPLGSPFKAVKVPRSVRGKVTHDDGPEIKKFASLEAGRNKRSKIRGVLEHHLQLKLTTDNSDVKYNFNLRLSTDMFSKDEDRTDNC